MLAWLAASVLALPLLSGCGTTQSSARYAKRPSTPMPVQALRVVFLETQYELTGPRPYLSSADVNKQRAVFSEAFRDVFPKTMADAGIKTIAKSATGDTLNNAENLRWLGAQPGVAHVLIVAPSGGRVFCTGGPCNFRFGLQAVLLSPDTPAKELWVAKLEQPDLTPGLTLGTRGDFEHYSRELARLLLQDTVKGAPAK